MDLSSYDSFAEFFETAEARGYSRQEAAERLLAHLKAVSWPVVLCGLREVRHYIREPDDHPKRRLLRRIHACESRLDQGPLSELEIFCGREVRNLTASRRQATETILARLIERWEATPAPFSGWRTYEQPASLRPVPHSVFAAFDAVDEDLRSYWQDDEEEPNASATANWLAGSLTLTHDASCSILEDVDLASGVIGEEVDYTTLHILKSAANEVLRYSKTELIELGKSYLRQSHFYNALKSDPKLGNPAWKAPDIYAAFKHDRPPLRRGNPNLIREV